MTKRRVAIFGGTFNPPHVGHVAAAESFFSAIEPDELIIIPDFLPPHKEYQGEVSAEDRLEMCKLAFGHIERVSVSDLEIKRGGRSYTAVTLEELSSPDKELYFLCGTDMFLTLDSWYCPEKIFAHAVICYIRRENDSFNNTELIRKSEEYKAKYGAKIIPISAPVVEVSSSKLREALLSDISKASRLLPDSIFAYIVEKRLYR